MIPQNPALLPQPLVPPAPKLAFPHFVANTLRWVALQLAVTCLVAGSMYEHSEAVGDYMNKHPLIFWGPVILLFVALAAMYGSGSTPARLLWFCVFTLAMSGLVGVSLLPYSPKTILLAAGATTFIVLAVALYSQAVSARGGDLDSIAPILGSGLTTLLILGVANMFLQLPWLKVGIAAASVFIFTGYLAFDLVRLYNKTDAYDPTYEDGLIPATEIYLDIINLFLNLLEVIAACSGDNSGNNS